MSEVCRLNAISENTFYRWRKRYGDVQVSEVRRLRELEAENARLKRLLAEHAFERFYLHRKYSGSEVGTGLGLAIVRELVEAMGGSVSVMSAPSGTTFEVRLRTADTVLTAAR